MILSDVDIEEAIDQNRIAIRPFDKNAIQPASIDLRLGNKFLKFDESGDDILDPKNCITRYMSPMEEHVQYYIQSGEFVLGVTQECVEIDNTLVARIEGKSSLGRLGLSIHTTAGFIDPGFKGYLTLEITNLNPNTILLTAGMWIAQIAFQRLNTPCARPYGKGRNSRYTDASAPEPTGSRIHENLR